MSTVVLVHGAWGRGEFWRPVVPHPEARGHQAVVVDQLPSAGSDPASLGDPAADVARVREVIDGLGDDAREDLVLGSATPGAAWWLRTYIVCTQDRAIPVDLHETMARRADQVLRIDTAHCPMLSAPEELAAVLDRAMDTGRTLAPSG